MKDIFGGQPPFETPKPSRLIERVLQITTQPGDLILDSFGGSGTTGNAVLRMNHAAPDQQPRRFIMVEMEPEVARDITAERVRREERRIRYKSRLGDCPSGATGWPSSMSPASRPLVASVPPTWLRCLDQGSFG